MNNTVREELYKALNDLLEKQFEEFKWQLKGIDHNKKPNIPTASLEKANRQEVVDLLIQYYEENAPDVCIHVLQKSNINDIARKLKETLQKDVDAHKLPDSSEYKDYIRKKFKTMKDPNAILDEHVSLEKRYSELIILDYHPSEEEREDEILATGKKHVEIIRKRAESSANIGSLFDPDKYGLIPRVVVLQGAAGIGKTITTKKIMFDWASQQLYQNKFDYAFYICCRKINVHAESEKSSIAEIISEEWLQCHESKNVIKNILKHEWEILFIIDGFDELGYSFDQPENYFCTDPWKKEPMRIILRSLFQKKLLSKSSLIITTRPTALEKLNQCLEHPRYFEILGFSTKEREEYFCKFFDDEHQAMQAFRYIKQNDVLFTMCVIPLVSWIICTVLKQEMKRGMDVQRTPCTLTAIYIRYFSSLLKFHHKESKQDIQSNVKGLCSLAAEGVWEQKTFFMEEEIKKHNLHQGNSLPLFLNQNIFRRDIDLIQTYSFIHFSFQEFFAALFYVLEEGDEQHSEIRNKNLRTLRPDFAVGFRFLFGFLNEAKRMRELKKEFGWEISPNSKEFLLECVKNNFREGRHNFQLQKEIFSYLYETQDDNFVNDALRGITAIDYQCNSDMELMILGYCIKHCQNLECLFVTGSKFLYHAETELLLPQKDLLSSWQSSGCMTAYTRKQDETNKEGHNVFREWNLDKRYMEDFFRALTELTNLTDLGLEGWSFTVSCSRHLAEVFRKNQRLKVLRLSLEDTEDRVGAVLYDGLQHPDCKIETLGIGEILTESCCRHLADVLRKNQRLRTLYLSLKKPDSKRMELYQGCKDPERAIDTLQTGEILNKSCSSALADVHRRKQRLSPSYLSLKKPDDRRMELLCQGLKDPECTIETLGIDRDILNESCSRHLADVLRRNQRLRALYLSLKYADDKILEVLGDELKLPECKIEILQISAEFIEKSCGRHMARILNGNHLRELYLVDGSTSEYKEKLLYEELKYSVHNLKELCQRIPSYKNQST